MLSGTSLLLSCSSGGRCAPALPLRCRPALRPSTRLEISVLIILESMGQKQRVGASTQPCLTDDADGERERVGRLPVEGNSALRVCVEGLNDGVEFRWAADLSQELEEAISADAQTLTLKRLFFPGTSPAVDVQRRPYRCWICLS